MEKNMDMKRKLRSVTGPPNSGNYIIEYRVSRMALEMVLTLNPRP